MQPQCALDTYCMLGTGGALVSGHRPRVPAFPGLRVGVRGEIYGTLTSMSLSLRPYEGELSGGTEPCSGKMKHGLAGQGKWILGRDLENEP